MKIKVINKSGNDLPKYETNGAAAMDLRAFLPSKITKELKGKGFYYKYKKFDSNYFITSEEDLESIVLEPNGRVLIPTGLYVEFPKGYHMSIKSRSGLSIKNGIHVLNADGLIDSDYSGEIGVILHNSSDERFEIKNGDRIAQAMLESHTLFEWEITDKLTETLRGEGGFNSTGIK